MKKFLINSLIFSLLTLMLLGICEAVVRSLPTSYAYKHEWICENGDKISTLVLGSSHTYYGLRPELLGDSVFNLANVSQTPEYDLVLLKTYLPIMPNLRRIIMPVSYFTYSDPAMEEGDEWKVAVRYKTQMHLPVHSDFSIYNLELTDFSAYTGKLKNLILKAPSNQCDTLGFGLGFDLAHRNPNWKAISCKRAEGHTRTTPGRFEEVIQTQESLIKTAYANNIEVIIITTPGWKDYTSAFNQEQFSEMQRGIHILTRSHGLTHYDFLNDTRFCEDDFYDPDHLSDIGGTKLSRILADTINKKTKCQNDKTNL